jgi:hypothetical protein
MFKPKNLKFWILIENYIITNDTSGFFEQLSIRSGIELEIGPSRIKIFFYYKKKTLNVGLEAIFRWSAENGLILNRGKTQAMIIW